MKKLLLILSSLLLLAPSLSVAGTRRVRGNTGGSAAPWYLAANLPSCTESQTGALVLVTDGINDADCNTGTGSYDVLCMCNGVSWEAAGDSGIGAGDDVSVDSTDVVDPNFIDSADINFTATGSNVTATFVADSVETAVIADGEIVPADLDATAPAVAGDVVHILQGGITQFEYMDKDEHLDFVGAADLTENNSFSADNCSGTPGGACNDTGWTIPASGAARFVSVADEEAGNLWSISTAGVITAVTYGEVAEANLVDKSATEAITGDWDFGGGGIEIENNTAVPGTCTVGQIFQDTDAASGAQLYACEGGTFVSQGVAGAGDLKSDGTVALSVDWNMNQGADIGITIRDITLDGTGVLNGLDSVDSTTEDTIEGLIFSPDSDAQTVAGNWTFAANQTLNDDKLFRIGTAGEWNLEYDESTDDQLLFYTTKTAAIDTGDPMFQILVGTTPTADQQIFGIAKGTQDTNTDLLTLDEDGDLVLGSSFTLNATGDLVFGATLDDDDCTGQEGSLWYDTTDNAFEFCQAGSGTPSVLGSGGGGVGAFSDDATIVQVTKTKEVEVGGGAAGITGKLEIGPSGVEDIPMLVIESYTDAPTDSIIIVQDATGNNQLLNLDIDTTNEGDLKVHSIQDLDGTSTWSVTTAGAASFASIATPAASNPTVAFDDVDDDDDTTPDAKIAVDCQGPAYDVCDMSFQVDSGTGSELTEVMLIDTTQAGATTVQIGAPGSNYVNITEGGVMSFANSADIDLPNNSVDTADITDLNVTEDKLAAALAFDDGDFLNLSAVLVNGTAEGIRLPLANGDACAASTAEGQICWDDVGNGLYVGNGAAAVSIANSTGDVSDVFNCASGDCSSIAAADGDLLNFNAVLVNGTAEGLILPLDNADACAAATGEGQVCWDDDNQDLYIGNGAAAVQMNGAAPATEVRSMYWGAGSISTDGTGCAAPTESSNTLIKMYTIVCADNDAGDLYGSTLMPDGWDAGTVAFTLEVYQVGASTNTVELDFAAFCVSSDEAVSAWDATPTGEQAASITLTATNDMLEADTAAVTVAGTTCAAGDFLFWTGQVDAAASHADIATAVEIVGVKMEYTSTIGD